ncbi:Spx/MgsR family RNA polymerase-binding regulatory protein [Accumulibacter sp.]|uniref:Spx/MgsR family RNA polymerase-binding regulatory protein n=1 Tax=Accumulibacter sp. TaxID=2053492 RepID=UPI002B9F2082|nr:Spx/MgsR family RNA polymerase-binding regulatory protein [Accumulibacter sp.]HPU79085.1 Spx/MgsR family RNA polymerase-binding regulatory protein [Accumulibacter sp.]
MHGKLQQVVRIYGIRNCDSMKKAFVWLAEHAVVCDFVDYRQAAPSAAQLADWNLRVGWKALLNTRGTTWRRLGEEDRADVDEARALTLMARHPSLIRRPVIDTGTALLVGFDPDRYARELLGRGP